jgi:hypothetical protein
MKLGMYIMAPEPISTVYFINPSHQSLSVCVSLLLLLGKGSVECIPPFTARQQLGKHVTTATGTHNNRIVGRVCLWACLCIPLSLLGNNSVKVFMWQQRIVGRVIFYVAHVISKESGQSLLPRTSCIVIIILWKIIQNVTHRNIFMNEMSDSVRYILRLKYVNFYFKTCLASVM